MNLADLFIAKKLAGGGGGGTGTDNYNDLSNKPQINSTALTGDKSASDLGLQSEIDSDNKISADYVDDTSASNKFVSAAEKIAWSGKQDAIDADHKIDADYVDDTTSDNKFVTASDKTKWNAKQNAIDSSHKLSSDLVDDTGHTNLFVTSTEKSTWNGKQDKIDSSHKLSSTLVSFDSSEAEALASGIDSAKVSQISTNQTNILYALSVGAKNFLTTTSGTYTDDGTRRVDLNINIPAGDYVIYFGSLTSTDTAYSTCRVSFLDSSDNELAYGQIDRGNNVYLEKTIDSTAVKLRIYYANGWSTSEGKSLTFSNGMVCPKAVWNTLGHDYQPPALPNYDLTQLEAEDRAALAEVVDSGAKNKFDISTATFDNQGGQFSVTYNGGSATIKRISGSATLTTPNFTVRLDPGTYVLSGCPSTGSDSTYRLDLRNSVGTVVDGSIDYGSGSSAFQISTAGTYRIALRFANGYTVPDEGITITPMICTLADWKISQKFVPHRKNLDELEATKAPILSGSITSGDLNDITINTFAMYANTVSSLPTSDNYYVETSVFDANSLLQRAYNIATAESYVRVKCVGSWSAWKQITNA